MSDFITSVLPWKSVVLGVTVSIRTLLVGLVGNVLGDQLVGSFQSVEVVPFQVCAAAGAATSALELNKAAHKSFVPIWPERIVVMSLSPLKP